MMKINKFILFYQNFKIHIKIFIINILKYNINRIFIKFL